LRWGNLFGLCSQLGCFGLPFRLQQLLLDETLDAEVRWDAFPLLEACEWSSVSGTLLQLVLNDSQPLKLRAEAAKVIADRGTATDKEVLLPFAGWSLPSSGQDKQINETLHHTKISREALYRPIGRDVYQLRICSLVWSQSMI
jgi:hypothetical protein